MKKKFYKTASIILGALFLLLLLGNFGLNYWLKNNLPDYLKKKTEYVVDYKSLDVHLGTGNILATGISIKNKNPKNEKVLRIDGTVDTLSISRFGIYDALFNKRINVANLKLSKPQLTIILAQNKKNTSEKEKNPLVVKNIDITDGNIQVFQTAQRKLVSVNHLDLKVKNLQMTEESTTNKLPFTFDSYHINAENLFFRTKGLYVFTAKYLVTEDNQFSIKDFAMIPLVSHKNFLKLFPEKKNLFDFKSSEMEFEDVVLKDNKIILTKVRFENPEMKMFSSNVKPVDKKKDFANDVQLDDVVFNNAKVHIIKADETPAFVGENINVKLSKFLMNEKTAKEKIPFQYGNFKIDGKKVHLIAQQNKFEISDLLITPKLLDLKNVIIKPTVSNSDKMLLDMFAKQIQFKVKDWSFLKNQLRINGQNLLIDGINGKMTAGKNSKTKSRKNDFNFDVRLDDLLVKNSKFQMQGQNGATQFSAGNLNANFKKTVIDKETIKGKVPFHYSDFRVIGQNIGVFSSNENVHIGSLSLHPKLIDLRKITLEPAGSSSNKSSMNLTAKQINIKINEFKFINRDLKLNVENVLIDELNGKILAAENPKKKKPDFSGIAFPLNIKTLNLKNSNLIYDKGNKPLIFKDLNANLQNIEMNSATIKDELPFKTGFYSVSTRNFNYKTQFYNLSASLVKVNKNSGQISNFKMLPTVSRAQFIRMIPVEKDLYNLSANQITMNGTWDLLSSDKFLEASQVTLDGVNADIFRSKIPEDDLTEKPMYAKLLRSIKFPMFIDNLAVKNSVLVYEEDTKKSDGPGKLTFGNFNMKVKNLNSNKMNGKPTNVSIGINCSFMKASPMKVNWNFDTKSLDNTFFISGNISDLSAPRINPFIEPYLNIRATGLISDLVFDFKGNDRGIGGKFILTRKDLKIALLNKAGEKNVVLSAVANIFVKSNSGNSPEAVQVENVERDNTKSFFNLFWRGIEQGLKKTLVGKSIVKTEENIKSSVEATKETIQKTKQTAQEAKSGVKEGIDLLKGKDGEKKPKKEKKKPKEKGFFQRIFDKKSDS